jgi:hypothetical protein
LGQLLDPGYPGNVAAISTGAEGTGGPPGLISASVAMTTGAIRPAGRRRYSMERNDVGSWLTLRAVSRALSRQVRAGSR